MYNISVYMGSKNSMKKTTQDHDTKSFWLNGEILTNDVNIGLLVQQILDQT